jgi:hypothetical protein
LSLTCASETRRHEFSRSPQLRGIGPRHAADIAVLEDAATCPFNHFTDGLLFGCGYASCSRQELVAELVET